MQLHRLRETPRYPGERVFGYSPLMPAVMTILLLAASCVQAALGWAIIAEGFGLLWLALAVVGVSLPITLLGMQACWSSFRACFRGTNWLVRYTPSGFLVKFRSYINHHFPDGDPTVVFLSASEIVSVRRTRVRREVLGRRGGTTVERLTYLDIRLRHADTGELAEAIAEERRRKAPKVGISRTKALHYPVSVPEPDLVRVEWKGMRTRLRKALEVFGHGMQVEEDLGVDSGRLDRLTPEEMDDLILTLCQSGDTIQAVKLIRRRYGWDTTRAKRFAEDLVGGGKPSDREGS